MSIELATGYIALVPSAKGFKKELVNQLDLDTLGRDLGDTLGRQLTQGVERQAGRINLPTNRITTEASKAGDKAGVAMRTSIEGKLRTTDVSGSIGRIGLGAAAGAAGIIAFAADAFDASSDLNEAQSKAATVFVDQIGRINEFAEGADRALGLSERAALEAAGTFGNLFRAMDINTEKAADMSIGVIDLAADLASFNNAKPEDVLLALRSGLVGETEPLRQFGVNLNEARIQSEALRLGLVRGNVNLADVQSATIGVEKAQKAVADATREHGANSLEARDANAALAQAQDTLEAKLAGNVPALDANSKAQAAYSLIMRDTALAQGDFERTADGAANKSRIAAAEFENLKASLGEKVAPIGNAILTGAIGGLDALNTWIATNGPGVIAWINETFGGPDGKTPVDNFKTGMETIANKFHEIFGDDSGGSLRTGAESLYGQIEIIGTKIRDDGLVEYHGVYSKTWWGDLLDQVGKLPEAFGQVEDQVQEELLDPIWGSVLTIVDGVGKAFGALKDDLLDPLFGVLQTFGESLGATFTWLKDKILDPLWGTIQSMDGSLTRLLNKMGIGTIEGEGKAKGFEDVFPRTTPTWMEDGTGTEPGAGANSTAGTRGAMVVSGYSYDAPAPGGGVSIGRVEQNFNNIRERETAFTLRHSMRELTRSR